MPIMRIFLFLSLVFSFSACSTLYGLKQLKPLSINDIQKQAKVYHIPSENSYYLDSSYRHLLAIFDAATQAVAVKNHSQPLQALYFNAQQQLVSFQVNCYAGGFPNLDWEQNGHFNTFPPTTLAPIDSLLSLNQILAILKPLNKDLSPKITPQGPTILVFWSRFMGRQSKRFIQLVQENHQNLAPTPSQIIYINTDNLFVP